MNSNLIYQDFILETSGEILIVKINFTRVTLKEVPDFRELINQKISEGFKKVIVDLTKSNFCDSTFMGALVLCYKKTVAKNGKFVVLTLLNGYINNLFNTTGLDRIINIYHDLESAIASLS